MSWPNSLLSINHHGSIDRWNPAAPPPPSPFALCGEEGRVVSVPDVGVGSELYFRRSDSAQEFPSPFTWTV